MKRARMQSGVALLALLAALASNDSAAARPVKVLLVVAHPDDEYNFAATTYRIARELGGAVDEVVITDGEGGYRYSLLAEKIYGLELTREDLGRARLPAIRKHETLRAGRILGIRHHYFLNQKDQGFTLDPQPALRGAWDMKLISTFLDRQLAHQRYDFVFTVLPTEDVHGHHQAATLLAIEAAARLPESGRPAILGAEVARHDEPVRRFSGNPVYPVTKPTTETPVFTFDRRTAFGLHGALNYSIVVNWMIAEHKSQGLFQIDSGKHDEECFWLFAASGEQSGSAVARLSEDLAARVQISAHR